MAKARYKTRATTKEGVYERFNADTGDTVAIFIKYDGPTDPITGKRDQIETSYIPDPSHPKGKRHFKNITEASKYRNKMMNEVAEGSYIAGDMTLGEVLDYWFEKKSKHKFNSKRTNKSTISQIKKHPISAVRISVLKFYQIQEYLDDLALTRKTNTVKQYKSVICSALEYAYSTEKIARNPAAALKDEDVEGLPSIPVDPPSPEEIIKLLDYLRDKCDQSPDDFGTRVMYVFEHIDNMTGLRIGEMCALQWSDILIDERCIVVGKTTLPGARIQDSTKNNVARKVYITDIDVGVLQNYRRFCKEMFLKFGIHLRDDHFVFPRFRWCGYGRNYIDPTQPCIASTIRDRHYAVLREAGLPRRKPHANRHGVSTYMQMETGANSKVVQDRLGHMNESTTQNTYTHVPKKIHLEQAEKSAEMFAKLGYVALR